MQLAVLLFAFLLYFALAVPGGKKYAVLKSLDLICDTPEEQELWYHMVCMLCYSTCVYIHICVHKINAITSTMHYYIVFYSSIEIHTAYIYAFACFLHARMHAYIRMYACMFVYVLLQR